MSSFPTAEVVADSVGPLGGPRLTTIMCKMHRFVLAELNTHRAFSRNSASSRARSMAVTLGEVIDDPAWPLVWPAEQRGMQGGAELHAQDLLDAMQVFEDAHRAAHSIVSTYIARHPDAEHRLHKSLLNRLLEPFMWHTVLITSTEWDNFWNQRLSPLAQPEFRIAAEAMRVAYDASRARVLCKGEYHLPFTTFEEQCAFRAGGEVVKMKIKALSTVRCARVSYRPPNAEQVTEARELEVFDSLRWPTEGPIHLSPFEHVASPVLDFEKFDPRFLSGNFFGWKQLRHELFGDYVPDYIAGLD